MSKTDLAAKAADHVEADGQHDVQSGDRCEADEIELHRLFRREQPLRAYHQDNDQEEEGDRVAVENVAEIDRAETLDHAEDNARDQRADHVAEAAQDDDRQAPYS